MVTSSEQSQSTIYHGSSVARVASLQTSEDNSEQMQLFHNCVYQASYDINVAK